MAKKNTVLNDDIRAAVQATFDAIDKIKPGIQRSWSQSHTALAIGFAAESHFSNGGMPTRKSFTKAFNDQGFLGNASQFRQALENLPADDVLAIERGISNDLADA